jgi:phage-related protein
LQYDCPRIQQKGTSRPALVFHFPSSRVLDSRGLGILDLNNHQTFEAPWGDIMMNNVYAFPVQSTKRQQVTFLANTLDTLRELDKDARKAIGYNIDRLQLGQDPEDWKPMSAVGPGVREIRVKVPSGTYRALYVQSKGMEIHVLNIYRKKDNAMRDSVKKLTIQRLKLVA